MNTLPNTLSEDILNFKVLLEKYRKKKIEFVRFKAFRILMGIYEQRTNDVYMLRIRITGGVIYPKQFSELIKIALKHHSNLLHITTRQEIQMQNLKLEEIYFILLELQKIGLFTKGGGGNTIRNIIVSFNSGISKNEIFDTTPHAMALATKLVDEQDSYLLPRKMKIAFSSCEEEKDYAIVNDIGFVAKIKEGERGFKVYVGGGGGSNPSIGCILFDFIPENELFVVVEAMKRMFFEQGNRKNRYKARIRYIFYKLGKEKTLFLIKKYYEEAKKTTALFIIEKQKTFQTKYVDSNYLVLEKEKKYKIWKKRYVNEQKQIGYVSILVPFEFGDISLKYNRLVESINNLLNFVSQFGEDTIRFTTTQNVQLRNIPVYVLPKLYFLIKEIVLEDLEIPLFINNIVSCTGYDICRFGVCFSKGLTRAIRDKLRSTFLNLDRLENARIHISGCLHSCGQHLMSDIGFTGEVLKNHKIYPGYQIYLAFEKKNYTNLPKPIGNIAARDIPIYLVRLLTFYLKNKSNTQNLTDYLKREGREKAIKLLKEYQKIPSFKKNKNYYFDWESNVPFSIVKKITTECSIGLFDLIEIDLKSIYEAKRMLETEISEKKINKYLYNIVYSSSHMLLLTKGMDLKITKDVFHFFLEYFIDKGLVEETYRHLIENIKKNGLLDLILWKKKIYIFSDTVLKLYHNMDDSLLFNTMRSDFNTIKKNIQEKKFKDLRGIVCPMNFVQIKIQLAQMKLDDELEIWLDDSNLIHNVFFSIQDEGHQILDKVLVNNFYWKIIIKKK